jgi:thiamine-monophosphate kinase
MDEFDLIRTWFAPLATASGAANLSDDVAEVELSGRRLIITTDAIVEGVHFLPGDPVASLAAKLVRVNVSDVIAKGGRPDGALLTLVWPRARPTEDIGVFARRLGQELAAWGGRLIGGDTCSTDGPLVLSMTLMGTCTEQGPVRRSGARVGDDVWVTGTIGDSWLGLQVLMGEDLSLSSADAEWVIGRYREPCPPPLALAECVSRFASASLDVSDGLVADAGHIAEASGVEVVIEAGRMPLSPAARRWLARSTGPGVGLLATGGDDYQTLFTASPADRPALEAMARDLSHPLTRIGAVEQGEGVRLEGAATPQAGGWRHF